MSEVVLQKAPSVRQHAARIRRRRDDMWIGLTALVGAMLALPLAQNSWNGPEVASVLAVSATAMLAGQRWAIALVVLAELLLVPTVVPRAFVLGADLPVRMVAFVSVAALVPGLLAMRRAAAAMVLVTGRPRTQLTCRRFHRGLVAGALLATILPLL